MINNVEPDWLRGRMPPEGMELCTGLEIKGELSGSFYLKDAWMILLQLPGFPKENILIGKELQLQPRIGLARQRVARLLSFGDNNPRGDELGGRNLSFFQNCLAFVSYAVLVCKLTL